MLDTKVLKLGPDRMVRLGKPRTAHFCGSFSLKNCSMGKKQGPIQIVVEPHSSKNCEQFSRLLEMAIFARPKVPGPTQP